MKETIALLRRQSESTRLIRLPGPFSEAFHYDVLVNSKLAAKAMARRYGTSELLDLRKRLEIVTHVSVDSRGIVSAAQRGFEPGKDPTRYDAVWIRDSLWVYLGLRSDPGRAADARRVLLALLDYLASPAQRRRLRELKRVHIRFDPSTENFADVRTGSVFQPWNHNQNDALGLLLDLAVRALDDGFVGPEDIKPEHWQSIALLAAYLVRIGFHEKEDAGAWEEIERLNTSSVALVTSGLESLLNLLESNALWHDAVVARLRNTSIQTGVARFLSKRRLRSEIEKGYRRVHSQLAGGGESPAYPQGDSRYREADAALLNLIYPARLRQLTLDEKRTVLRLVRGLAGRAGIRRYRGDSYQSGNFWFAQPAPGSRRTKPAQRSREEFISRALNFIPDTEAQWFFDSWYSLAAGSLFAESVLDGERDLTLGGEQVQFFNRALGQITAERTPVGADGNPVSPLSLPESYNTLVFGGASWFAPSPICPLNWAKASLLLSLSEMERSGYL